MFDTLKNWLGLGENDQDPLAKNSAVQRAVRAVEADVGRSIPHQLISRTRGQLGGVLGRFSKAGGQNRVEVNRDVLHDTAETFKTVYHELLHAFGLMDEGTVEGLTQLAALRHGIQNRVQAVAYPERVRAFNKITELVTPGVKNARDRFNRMLKWAQGNEFTRQTQTAVALREKGHSSSAAQTKAQQLLADIR